MDVPPSRYKVVEQGRRLVVLDTWNGNAPASGKTAAPAQSARPATVEQARAALRPARRPPVGGMAAPAFVISTQRWFDDKAPRRIAMGSDAQPKLLLGLALLLPVAVIVLMLGWPAVLVAGFILAQPSVRKGLRGMATRMLDGLAGG